MFRPFMTLYRHTVHLPGASFRGVKVLKEEMESNPRSFQEDSPYRRKRRARGEHVESKWRKVKGCGEMWWGFRKSMGFLWRGLEMGRSEGTRPRIDMGSISKRYRRGGGVMSGRVRRKISRSIGSLYIDFPGKIKILLV